MLKSIISEGKTTNEAIENGLKKLNVSKNDVEIRILENTEKRSFFSILTPRVVKVELKIKENIRKLDPTEYEVTQNSATEIPFSGKYNDFNEKGLYVDVVSGEPLFTSHDKFNSGCGWPSFSKPITEDNIKKIKDTSHNMIRTEVKSKKADSHLGHVFDDGPSELGGMRYCINSAALKFIAFEDLEKEGYGKYIKYFEK